MTRYKKNSRLIISSLAAALILAACGGNSETSNLAQHTAMPQAAPLSSLSSTSADTVSFPGKRANYTITKISAGFIVTDNVGSSGSKTLSNVKNLQFSDVRVNLQIGDKVNTIATSDLSALIDLYIAFFNRVPDADGLAYWIDRFNAGMTQDQIAESFYSAALAYPAQTGYSASMSNDDFIRIIYKNVLGRTGANAPTDVEVQYWSTQLTKGIVSKGAIVKTMLVAAREYANDAKWGWVTRLLDNKQNVANFFAIQQGLNYNSTEETITKTMAIASAVTSSGTADAIALIGVND
ncbi:MAG: DUF4214 domain-containing protein, partial [Burkholderiales bacterium]|nr:DUF4214 domain-containing protein [Burkholderiales bacterium]